VLQVALEQTAVLVGPVPGKVRPRHARQPA
jgi:hypothetical protein